MRKLAVVAVTALIACQAAQAQDRLAGIKPKELTGDQLLSVCSRHNNSRADAFCAGYVAGFIAALDRSENLLVFWVCTPAEITVGQARSLIEADLRQTQEDPKFSFLLKKEGASAVFAKLRDAFPCGEEHEKMAKALLGGMDKALDDAADELRKKEDHDE